MDLLSLFSINENVLRNFILNQKPQMSDFKKNLSLLTEEYFVNKLFSTNNKNNKKFQLLDDLEKNYSEGSKGLKFRKIISNAKRKMELINNNQMNDKIKFTTILTKKRKDEIIENYYKFIHENDNFDYTDKSYKVLMNSFYKFKQFNNLNNDNNINENKCDNIFEIKIYLRFLYDTPFVMLAIEEIMKLNEKKHCVVFANNFNSSTIMTKNTLRKKITAAGATTNNSAISGSTTASINLSKVSQYNNKKEKNSCLKYTIFIIFILICFIFAIYIAIIVYQSIMLNNIYNIFLALFYDYGQRDSLLRLYSAMISGYFQYLSLSNYTIFFSLDEFNSFITRKSSDYSENYHLFYKYYIEYNFKLGDDLKTLYRNYNFSKIGLDWKKIIYTSNFIGESDNMVHLSTSAVTNPNKEEIKEDLNLFFNARYRDYYDKDEIIVVHSNYLVILYYFSVNYNSVYNSLFQDLQNEIQLEYHHYTKVSKNTYIIIETLGLIVNFVFCGILIFFLIISNKEIFHNILNLFLDYTQPENSYTLKNNIDNKILIEKLKQLNYLMENFNLNSLDKYNKIISHDTALLLEEKKITPSLENNKIESRPSSTQKITKVKKSDNNVVKKKNDQANNMSKTSNKLLSPDVGEIVSKLNPKNTNNTGNTKNHLLSQSSSNNNIIKNNLIDIPINNEEVNDDVLTTDKIFEKTYSKIINIIKINITIVVIILFIIIAYFVIKTFISLQQINTMFQIFDDFGYVTHQYSLIYYYYNNLCMLIINKKLGDESIFDTMTSELLKESANSNEVKTKRLSNYQKTFEIMSILNKEDKNLSNEKFETILCQKNTFCKNTLNSKYNLFSEGADIAFNSIFYQIQNTFKDYSQIKNTIYNISDISSFIGSNFERIDMNLNFIINLVEKRINKAFLEDVNDLKKAADDNVIIFNTVIIVFLSIMTLLSIFMIIRKIMNLDKIIENSTLRLNKAFCFVKLKNMGLSMKTSTFV